MSTGLYTSSSVSSSGIGEETGSGWCGKLIKLATNLLRLRSSVRLTKSRHMRNLVNEK